MIDSTDPTIGISCGLFTPEFYTNVSKLMKPGAMFSQQCDTNAKAVENLFPVLAQTPLK